jgi:hypothetical protein
MHLERAGAPNLPHMVLNKFDMHNSMDPHLLSVTHSKHTVLVRQALLKPGKDGCITNPAPRNS